MGAGGCLCVCIYSRSLDEREPERLLSACLLAMVGIFLRLNYSFSYSINRVDSI